MELSSLPGFRDFYPEEAAKKDYIFGKWRETALKYGFVAYDGPPLESTDLYRKKSGDELLGQLYCFIDKGQREVSLRPELTPSLARMVAAKGNSIPKPIKWFSTPQLFRYERQQRGRLREHFQFNCDILGETDVSADAELVSLLMDTLRSFGLTSEDFVVRVSDRPLLSALIQNLGVTEQEQQKNVFTAIDKITRESPDQIKKKMVEGGLKPDQADQILELFQLKTLSDITSKFDASPAICERVITLQQFFGKLESMGLKDYAQFDLTIVRGLAYYTGIVFEAFDRKGELRAISGGGRYDHLVEKVGGISIPALGFGMGDVVLAELLTEKKLWPNQLIQPIDAYVVLTDEKLRPMMLALVHQLRNSGFRIDYPLTGSNVGKQFKAASQKPSKFAIIIGEEWSRGAVKIKNLSTRNEIEVPLDQLHAKLTEPST